MTKPILKNKIRKIIDQMDLVQLNAAYLLVKEIKIQFRDTNTEVDKTIVDQNISKGIQQLASGKGTDFKQFLMELD